jgi:hypothetical protein
MINRKSLTVIFALIAVTTSLVDASRTAAAGGAIAGQVTDAKGAAVASATVTIIDSVTNQISKTVQTDAQGRYKIESLPAGIYTVTITAKGFGEARRENVKVEESAVATVDVRLEVAPIEVGVTVNAGDVKPNSDPLYQQLRRKSSAADAFAGPVATVNNLVLKRDAATFTLRSGEIYFLAPSENHTTGAVFIGDGELELLPPTEVEQKSLAIFTNEPRLKEQFSQLVLRFTDKTFDEVKASPQAAMHTGGAQASRAREIYREKESLLHKDLHVNLDLRTLADLYAEPPRAGFFIAFINGKRFNKLVFHLDPMGIPEVSPEQVLLLSYGETDGGFWTAFHLADEYRKGTATSAADRRMFDITHHDIEGAIRGTRITATDTVTLRPLVAGARVLPFDLYRTLRVVRVQDETGRDLNFVQEAKDEDADFAVILPHAPEVGKSIKLIVQYDGEGALRDSGGGNFILLPQARSSWYPNNAGTQFGDRATFNITFRYPKSYTFIGTGAPVESDAVDKDMKVSKWTSGTTELAVAGFNYGRFKKKELVDKDTNYDIEFYANEEVPDELKAVQQYIDDAERAGYHTATTLGSISTASMGNIALVDTQNAMRIYNAYFGKLPYTRLAMTQQPAFNFGQAWPTLVFMPYTAFIDTTQRVQLFGVHGGTNNFWRYVGPHEVAHQWWGHSVGWTSYHDQWMSEGFAEFSASLYVQFVRRDINKFIDFWEDQRKLIIEATPATKDRKPYTVGPVTQGYRLNNGKTGSIARAMIYPKGAYILHMLRMMMYDPQRGGDARFREMMKDFIQTYYNKDISTEDFKHIVEKHMTNEMDLMGNKRMDWFFNEWVYGTEIPSYKLEYQITTVNGAPTLSGRITQAGVSGKFRMLVPLYVDFGKGLARLGSATLVGDSSAEIPNIPLPAAPKKVAICALNDVLATSIENNKK